MSKYVRKFWFEGQLALAFGAILLLAAVALADPIPVTVWPSDGPATGEIRIKEKCDAVTCKTIVGCDKRENHQDLTALGPEWKYVKIVETRAVGKCNAFVPGAAQSNCTVYEYRYCALLRSYKVREEGTNNCIGESTDTWYRLFETCEI